MSVGQDGLQLGYGLTAPGDLDGEGVDTRFFGQSADDQAGAYVAVVDVDANGLVDPVIGPPFQDRGANAVGAVYGMTGALRGDVGLAAATVAQTMVSAHDNVRRPASGGDLDGDGLEDVLVSARLADSEAGVVYGLVGGGL